MRGDPALPSVCCSCSRSPACPHRAHGAPLDPMAAMPAPLRPFPATRLIFTWAPPTVGSTNPLTMRGYLASSGKDGEQRRAGPRPHRWSIPPTPQPSMWPHGRSTAPTADCGSATMPARTWSESDRAARPVDLRLRAGAFRSAHALCGNTAGRLPLHRRGATWHQISPPDSHEIHEVESLAVDPANPDIVYAGTWHLPWKTTDGGENLAEHQAGPDRRLRCVLHHRRSRAAAALFT